MNINPDKNRQKYLKKYTIIKKKYKICIFVHIDTISDNNEPHYKTELFRRCRWG
jgi:hypothetical protein